ncbi:PfkB family carbohydrate kinase [Oricola thermophila]|nr:PfkB family carbohydrate kinase [Oricola thermophila]
MDLYPEPVGTKIADAVDFSAMLGGSAANIAAGLSRLGCRASLMTALSDDPVGRFCANRMAALGIGQELVARSGPETRTSLALSETRLEDHETLIYRNGAADFDLSMDIAESVDFTGVDALVVTGTALAREPSRAVVMRAVDRARQAGTDVVLDLDYRPYSWSSVEEASAVCYSAARKCQIVVGNDLEFAVMYGRGRPEPDLAQALHDEGVRLCIYKMGQQGAVSFNGQERLRTGIYPVSALKPVGAGDAFLASFLAAHYTGLALKDSIARGSAAAAIVVSRKGCADAMPTQEDVTEFMAQQTMTNPTKG